MYAEIILFSSSSLSNKSIEEKTCPFMDEGTGSRVLVPRKRELQPHAPRHSNRAETFPSHSPSDSHLPRFFRAKTKENVSAGMDTVFRRLGTSEAGCLFSKRIKCGWLSRLVCFHHHLDRTTTPTQSSNKPAFKQPFESTTCFKLPYATRVLLSDMPQNT